MPQPVLHQLPLHVEGLAALVAGEHLLGRVRLLVLLQVTEVTEPCRARQVFSRSAKDVPTGTAQEQKGNGFTSAADVTQVWLLSRVDDDVTLDVARSRKPVT